MVDGCLAMLVFTYGMDGLCVCCFVVVYIIMSVKACAGYFRVGLAVKVCCCFMCFCFSYVIMSVKVCCCLCYDGLLCCLWFPSRSFTC